MYFKFGSLTDYVALLVFAINLKDALCLVHSTYITYVIGSCPLSVASQIIRHGPDTLIRCDISNGGIHNRYQSNIMGRSPSYDHVDMFPSPHWNSNSVHEYCFYIMDINCGMCCLTWQLVLLYHIVQQHKLSGKPSYILHKFLFTAKRAKQDAMAC